MADSFARRGESEARADCRPMVETRIERTSKLLRKKAQPARPIQLNRSGSAGTLQLGGKGWRCEFFRKTRRERGAGRL